METRRIDEPLTEKNIRFIIMIGLVICASMIIMSVEYLFRSERWIEFTIATTLFIIIVIIIRKLNTTKTIEKSSINS